MTDESNIHDKLVFVDTTPPAPPAASDASPPNPATQITTGATIATSLLTALAGILATPYGIYIAAGVAVLALVVALIFRSQFLDWKFKKDEAQAATKVGGEVATDTKRNEDNRDAVDDFVGRDRRT